MTRLAIIWVWPVGVAIVLEPIFKKLEPMGMAEVWLTYVPYKFSVYFEKKGGSIEPPEPHLATPLGTKLGSQFKRRKPRNLSPLPTYTHAHTHVWQLVHKYPVVSMSTKKVLSHLNPQQ